MSATPLTHPDRLALAAMLEGIEAAPPERCRVLEIGCGEGANLLPMAFHLDESTFVGVDASAERLARAEHARDRLGLDNLKLHRVDEAGLVSFGAEAGPFDYVIAPDVFSSSDDEGRAGILSLVRERLAPTGLALIGYASTRGQAIEPQLRRALQRRTADAEGMEEKLGRARELLAMLASSPLREVSPHGALLAFAAAAAARRSDSDLERTYLRPGYRTFERAELEALAAAHDLAVVAELSQAARVDVETTVREGLSTRYDAGEAEDLLDLMLARPERAALLARRDAVPTHVDRRAAAHAAAAKASFAAAVQPAAKRFSLDPDVAETWITARGVEISARPAPLKAALVELGRWWPRALTLAELTSRAEMLLELRQISRPGVGLTPAEREALVDDLLELARLEYVEMRLFEAPIAPSVSAEPRVSPLTRFEAERREIVTDPRHRLVALDPFARHLVALLDGARPSAELTEKMLALAEHGGIVFQDAEGARLEGEALAEAIGQRVESTLEALAARGLLTA